jgi:hypothetical protein
MNYKIVERIKGEFVIYTKKRFVWKVLKRMYVTIDDNYWSPILFYSHADALAKVHELVIIEKQKEQLAKQKFKKKSTYFNKDGKEYDPKYGDGTKSYSIGLGRPPL